MWRYEYPDIVSCAESLHEHTTGSSDALAETEEKKVVEFLKMRLEDWQSSRSESARYDEAVRQLVREAIAEYLNSHWVRRCNP